jgi:cytochrome c oxidase cbb3-type subunit 3
MFTGMKRSAFLTPLSLMLFVVPAQAQNPARIEMGHKLFQKNCSACHGSEAKGGRGPDLTTGHWKSGSSDADILRNILTGIAGTQMPAFPCLRTKAAQL